MTDVDKKNFENEDLEKDLNESEKNENYNVNNEKNSDEINSLKNQLVRLQADFTNFKNRSKKIEADSIGIGIEKMAEGLFPVIDNFQIAISHMDDPGIKEGVEMIYNQILDSFKAEGIEIMNTVDAQFDPNLHYAVMMEEVEGVENGKILETIKAGFIRGEKVLRPAMVKVSK